MSPTSEIERCAYIVGLERVLSIFPSVAHAVARHWAESEAAGLADLTLQNVLSGSFSYLSIHWHAGGAGARATSEGCPRQIVEYSGRVYGFQCHLELTPELIDRLIAASAAELATLTNHRFVQQPEILRSNTYQAMNRALFVFPDRLVDGTTAR